MASLESEEEPVGLRKSPQALCVDDDGADNLKEQQEAAALAANEDVLKIATTDTKKDGETESPPGKEKEKSNNVDVAGKDGEAHPSREDEESKEEVEQQQQQKQQDDDSDSVGRELEKKSALPTSSPPLANSRPRRKEAEAATARIYKSSKSSPSSSSSSPKKKKTTPSSSSKGSKIASGAPTTATTKRKKVPAKNTKQSDDQPKKKKPKTKTKTNKDDIGGGGPKVDGRSKNKGSAKRESYSVTYKAKMVREFDQWEADQIKGGNKSPSVREFVLEKKLPHKYENFLSKSNGWRSPKNRARILQDSTVSDYQHMARMPDRTKNKSYYADMEEALLKRLEEARAKNLTVTTKTIRELAREELRRLTNNDEEKVNAFKASNGWVYNFLKRQERKAKDEVLKQKREKANLKKQQQQKAQQEQEQQQEEEASELNSNSKEMEGAGEEEEKEQGIGGGSSSKVQEGKIGDDGEKSASGRERPATNSTEPPTTAPKVTAVEGNAQQANTEEGSRNENAATTQNKTNVDPSTVEI